MDTFGNILQALWFGCLCIAALASLALGIAASFA